MVTGANKPFHRQDSNNTVSQNAHLIADPKNPSQDPVNQIALAIEKLANRNPQPSLLHSKNTLTIYANLEKNENVENFAVLFHTTLKTQPNLTEELKINHFHAHLRRLALKPFKNIQRTTTTIGDFFVVFRAR